MCEKGNGKMESRQCEGINCSVMGKIICSDLLNFKRSKIKSLEE